MPRRRRRTAWTRLEVVDLVSTSRKALARAIHHLANVQNATLLMRQDVVSLNDMAAILPSDPRRITGLEFNPAQTAFALHLAIKYADLLRNFANQRQAAPVWTEPALFEVGEI